MVVERGRKARAYDAPRRSLSLWYPARTSLSDPQPW